MLLSFSCLSFYHLDFIHIDCLIFYFKPFSLFVIWLKGIWLLAFDFLLWISVTLPSWPSLPSIIRYPTPPPPRICIARIRHVEHLYCSKMLIMPCIKLQNYPALTICLFSQKFLPTNSCVQDNKWFLSNRVSAIVTDLYLCNRCYLISLSKAVEMVVGGGNPFPSTANFALDLANCDFSHSFPRYVNNSSMFSYISISRWTEIRK